MSEITQRLTTAIADRYVIERELGAGGMATVYLAQDLKHDRKVALKVLRPELAAVLGAERFVQEIKTTAALQHPHILPLFDSGTADGFLFYVMPFIDGETLRSRLNRESQLGVDEAVKITTEIADALHYAHTQGVIHRDIKPENILIQDGRPMVADFGIALAVSAAAGGRMTETGLSLGTPHYMSPEQATAEKEITARSDVYSLGSVLYEMLAGSPPHLGGSAQQIIMKIVTEEAAPVTKHRKSVPPHVAAAVAQSIEKLPADRFDTAKAFAEALHNPAFTSATAIAAGVSTRPRVHASTLTRGLAAALVVMTALAGWALLRSAPAPVPMHLRIALNAAIIPPGLVGRNLALSPDGSIIVFSDTTDAGERYLFIKTPDRDDPEPLTGTAGGRAPTFSPDGAWIAFVADGRLRKVPLQGGSAITIADSAENVAGAAVAWLDNGTMVFNDNQFMPRLVDEEGGATRRLANFAAQGVGAVAIDPVPGTDRVLVGLCQVGCPTSSLVLMDMEGTVDTLVDGVLRGWALTDHRVFFARTDGGVFMAPLNVGEGRFSAPPVPVLDGVRTGITEADIVLSANGTLLYVPGAAQQGTAPTQVYRVSRDGTARVVDSSWVITPNGNGGIRLSPDGRRLALAVTVGGSQDIWVKDLDDGPFTRLTFSGLNSRPEWSRDGRYVYYSQQPELASSDGVVWRRRADGTGEAELTLDLPRAIWEIQQPADTSMLLLRFGVPPTRDIYLYRPGGAGDSLTPLSANDGYEETAVALSPDGRWMAYASNESGRYEIYVRPFPDASQGRWQVSRDGGNEPRWAHSGRELFYRREDGRLVSVAVQPGVGSFRTGAQQVLFQTGEYIVNGAYADWVVSPDDRSFLFKRLVANSDARTANTAILVQHWLAELDERGVGGR